MDTSELGKQYFAKVMAERFSDERLSAIRAAIEANGYWEENEEWRICTYIASRIEPIEQDGQPWYRVSVKNGVDFECLCPTIKRAVEFLGLFESTSMGMFYSVGWSSWAEKTERVASK
jgi:hypothetical protein